MIKPGTILIAKGALLPASFQLETESYPSAWMSGRSSHSAHELENELAGTGWTSFYLAGGITATAIGVDTQKTTDSALNRLSRKVKEQGCNCLEIDQVETRSFFGIPRMRISGHARNIQEETLLSPRSSAPTTAHWENQRMRR